MRVYIHSSMQQPERKRLASLGRACDSPASLAPATHIRPWHGDPE
ncbi:rCG50445 [Rattus norvegicus]|uniref:RCG50445 n=1 Tax=Rattus norvegicus TaxID=10116 RepID=A6JYM2_RAT|nr:rCG50445 [Rattus norvegicus]